MTITNLTAQEIFDRVLTHLRTQGQRSAFRGPQDPQALCLYRGPNGTRCAVGILIPDTLYQPEWEYHTVEDLITARALPSWFEAHKRLLSDLQWLHDADASWDSRGFIGEDEAQTCAFKHGLTYTPPEAR